MFFNEMNERNGYEWFIETKLQVQMKLFIHTQTNIKLFFF